MWDTGESHTTLLEDAVGGFYPATLPSFGTSMAGADLG